jgi:hypothetical protein
MSNPKDQHFFPVVFLKGFTNEQGYLHFFDSKKKKSEPRNPKSVAKEPHLYTVSSADTKNFKIEEKFSEIESNFSGLLQKIRSTGTSDIETKDIVEIINFIVLLFVRSPTFTKISEQTKLDSDVHNDMRKIDAHGADQFISSITSKKGLLYALTLADSFKHRLDIITKNFDAYLLTAEEYAPSFIINDKYACWEILTNKEDIPYVHKDIDWKNIQIKKHFPISRKCCISFVPKDQDRRYLQTHEMKVVKALVSISDVKVINTLSFNQKDRYAYSADTLSFPDS